MLPLPLIAVVVWLAGFLAVLAQAPSGKQQEMEAKSSGCVTCHTATDSATMHRSGTVYLGCADCHGGDPSVPAAGQPGTAEYGSAKRRAHPQPRTKALSAGSANPQRIYTDWLKEDVAYIRFVNPGDLRVAAQTCGSSGCHGKEVRNVRSSMMTHGAMLWGAALYNNGSFNRKDPHFGESYDAEGRPQGLKSFPPPTPEETKNKGILPSLEPLPRWETSQPGNVLRAFERGGRPKGEVGNPDRLEEPGKPDFKLSTRGFGTGLRTDPVFLGLQKTRLLDPMLSFPGTNDHPGDYRHSGCTACHVVYANDRSTLHSGPYAKFGHEGKTATVDPTIPRNESGHPIRHEFTRSIPSSQCMVCHMHPGTNMVASYFGLTWWDNEMDAELMYPKTEKKPSAEEIAEVQRGNPEGAAVRGLWAEPGFLNKTGTSEFNSQLQHTQFADFHGHGWIYRAAFKQDRKGNLLDAEGKTIDFRDPDRFQKAVHLKDIHLEKGMHCTDCHFTQDVHGNGKLYGETRNANELDCTDCHGTVTQKATLRTSGPAAPAGGTRLDALRTPWEKKRFYWNDSRLFQRSTMEPDKEWEVVQVQDSITPGNPHFNERSRTAKTILKSGHFWDTSAENEKLLAHANSRMTCYACHSSWSTSCFGCHLSMTANQKMPMLHNEGLNTRNWTSYNFQVLRDDSFMLGVDGTATGHRIAPVRSACAIVVSSQNQDRDWIYSGQQTVSAEGLAGAAFSPFVPHTVRARETKGCEDCHVSSNGDNNAWMAQLLLQGTNFLNSMGRYVYVAARDHGFEAVAVAEQDEPPAVIGSDFHSIVYPERYKKHVAAGSALQDAHEHSGGGVLDLQLRGEYLYTAEGAKGVRIYDVANIDNKDYSERIVTAPVSPLGQRLFVRTKNAMAIVSPTTLAVDPLRTRRPENEEPAIHPLYAYLYVADKEEGLIVLGNTDKKKRVPGVGTLLDGDPRNNFIGRALTFNPENKLAGARSLTFAGAFAYVLCDRGLVVVDMNDPLHPRIVSEIGSPALNEPRSVAVQFRYAFVADRDGLKVLDITRLAEPQSIPGATITLDDAHRITVARTYAYIANGKSGLAIVDVERPEHPRLVQMFNAGGAMNDVRDVKIGMTSSSQFAYIADGKNGLRVVQLFSPQTNPGFNGFSPRPNPKLVATRRIHGEALAISRGVDRDRAVDEGGNQLAVFGRRGSRPFNQSELQRMYLRDGKLYTVTDSTAK